jgi:L-aminopeptidase/D-esterase-like protein
MPTAHDQTPAGQPRARGLKIPFAGRPGPWNAITDVPGVEVGYVTLIQGDRVRTGVTGIHPRGRSGAADPVAAGFHSQNGNGEMTGVSWITESGTFTGPIAITNTHAVGVAHAGIIDWTLRHHPEVGDSWLLPVAAETWDGYLNDINGPHVTQPTVIAALDAARSGPVEEGSGGGGTGMNCYRISPVTCSSPSPPRTPRHSALDLSSCGSCRSCRGKAWTRTSRPWSRPPRRPWSTRWSPTRT